MSFLIQRSLSSVHPSVHPRGLIQITYLPSTDLPPSLPTYLPTCIFPAFLNFISFLILSSLSHPWGGLIHSRHLLTIRGPIHIRHPNPRFLSKIPSIIRDPHPRFLSRIPSIIRDPHPRFLSRIPSTIRDPHPRFLSKIPSTIRDPIQGPHIFEVTSEAPSPDLCQNFIHLEVPSTVSFFKGPRSLIQIWNLSFLGLIQCLLPQGSLHS
jgi:hypothetical protein